MSTHDEVVGRLTAAEVRVLGCLVEKESTVPDSYPLTLNSLRSACNQSTSRDPVVSYTEPEIETVLGSLRTMGITRTVHSTSNRATKYRHVVPDVLEVDSGELALLSVLMLRGPQTVGELKGRTERQHRFDSIEEVSSALAALAGRSVPLVRQLQRQPGQKDARWVHLLGQDQPVEQPEAPAGLSGADQSPAESPADAYGEATAEFYDLLATHMWDDLGVLLLELLEGVDPADGPIIDIGCGSGIGLPYVQVAVPGVHVFAIEPSKAMRVALHARLTDYPELRAITTVAPTRFASARLPKQASAIIASAVYGHLNDDERRHLWEYVAESMPVGAPVVVGVLPPERPIAFDPVCYSRLPVGDYVYEGWQSGTPIDDRRMSWTLSYKVVDASEGTTIAEYRATAPWRCDSVDDVRADIAEWDLQLSEHQGCVVVRPEQLNVRGLVQRVERASVDAVVDGEPSTVGAIGPGLCVLVGVTHGDTPELARKLADKIWNLRLLDDEHGVMNRSLADRAGEGGAAEVLVVSQFTLYGNTEKGRRPSWIEAARPEQAEPLVNEVVSRLGALGATVATGRFRTEMKVELVNDGPVTLMLEL